MSWHQGLHNPISKFHLTLDEKDSTEPNDDRPPPKRRNTTRKPQVIRPPVTWGDIKSLTTSAQQLLTQRGLECTPENLVTALIAKLTQNSINTLSLIICVALT